MPKRVSVIGAGTIGASWAACFLARGFEVAAYDPSPNGEAFARRFIDNAWPTLEKLGTRAAGADRDALHVFNHPAAAAKGADFVQESGPEREDTKIDLFAVLDAAAPPETWSSPSSSSGLLVSRVTHEVQAPGALRHRPSVQSAASHSAGRGGRRREDFRRGDRQGDGFLSRARQAADPHQERSARAMSPTACRRRCGARRFISSPKAWCRFPMPMRRLPMAPACAGR